jgi:hypothetical protein
MEDADAASCPPIWAVGRWTCEDMQATPHSYTAGRILGQETTRQGYKAHSFANMRRASFGDLAQILVSDMVTVFVFSDPASRRPLMALPTTARVVLLPNATDLWRGPTADAPSADMLPASGRNSLDHCRLAGRKAVRDSLRREGSAGERQKPCLRCVLGTSRDCADCRDFARQNTKVGILFLVSAVVCSTHPQ